MLADLVGVFTGIALFPLFLLAPGYAIAGLTGLLGFRRRSLNQKLGLSLLLSIAVCPIATYLLARFGSFVLVWIAYGAVWAIVVALLVKRVWEQRRTGPRLSLSVSHSTSVAGAIALAWIVLAVASLIDIQDSGRAPPLLQRRRRRPRRQSGRDVCHHQNRRATREPKLLSRPSGTALLPGA